jgi:hypothetical protein
LAMGCGRGAGWWRRGGKIRGGGREGLPRKPGTPILRRGPSLRVSDDDQGIVFMAIRLAMVSMESIMSYVELS